MHAKMILKLCSNSLKLAMCEGKEFHNLIADGKKECQYESQLHCKCWECMTLVPTSAHKCYG